MKHAAACFHYSGFSILQRILFLGFLGSKGTHLIETLRSLLVETNQSRTCKVQYF